MRARKKVQDSAVALSDPLTAAYQEIERQLDTPIYPFSFFKRTYRMRAESWLNGLKQAGRNRVYERSFQSSDHSFLCILDNEIKQYDADRRQRSYFTRMIHWLSGKSKEIEQKRQWVAYHRYVKPMALLCSGDMSREQQKSCIETIQKQSYGMLPHSWSQAFFSFKKLALSYFNQSLPSKTSSVVTVPVEAKSLDRPLVTLPVETWINISSYLFCRDAISLAYTCRAVKKAADSPRSWEPRMAFYFRYDHEEIIAQLAKEVKPITPRWKERFAEVRTRSGPSSSQDWDISCLVTEGSLQSLKKEFVGFNGSFCFVWKDWGLANLANEKRMSMRKPKDKERYQNILSYLYIHDVAHINDSLFGGRRGVITDKHNQFLFAQYNQLKHLKTLYIANPNKVLINIGGLFIRSIMYGSDEVLSFLLSIDKSAINRQMGQEQQGDTFLSLAAAGGHVSIVNLIIEAGAHVDLAHTVSNSTALHAAAARGHSAVVKILIEKKVDVNFRDRDGETALYQAVDDDGNVAVIKDLIEAKADVNLARTDNGETPLSAAVKHKFYEYSGDRIVQLLLESGADIDKLYNGRSILDIAVEKYGHDKNDKIVGLIKKEKLKRESKEEKRESVEKQPELTVTPVELTFPYRFFDASLKSQSAMTISAPAMKQRC